MGRILIVDDELRVRDLIKKYAKFEGYEVCEASNGLKALEICRTHEPDIIIMDVMMPELDGFSACREIRKFSNVPIIMLSARGEEYDKVHGFESGVDDYVVKPFSPKELMMRIGAILKRGGVSVPEAKEVYKLDGLVVDFTGRLVTVDGKHADMSPREYDLFFFLVKNRGIALSREKLINEVWGYDFLGDDRTIDTHIKQLRKILGPYSRCISTLRGVGYRFDE
ncbi:MAG: response regulator transcription factor [Oscillospiraceae bacterium]|nr:response regulator transcription factor [Oscillospiraceae bacterium]